MRKEIEILKALAIFAVIILHFNAFQFTPKTLILDQLLRFCVPLFVALSGYTLAKKYFSVPLSLKDFYIRRTTKLLPSYIFWSLVIFITMTFAFNSPLILNPLSFLKMFVWGQADYQLYFVPMIFQLYLLFPLLFFLLKRFSIITLIVCLVIQIVSYCYYFLNPQFNDQSQYIHFVTWIFYFFLGMFLAKEEIKLTSNKTLIISLLLIVIGFAWCLVGANAQILKHVDLIVVTKTARYPVILYATGIITVAILFSKKILLLPQRLVSVLAFLGIESFVIYLSHTLFLRLIFSFTNPKVYQGDVMIIFTGLLTGLLLTYFPRIIHNFVSPKTVV